MVKVSPSGKFLGFASFAFVLLYGTFLLKTACVHFDLAASNIWIYDI